jgi:cell wall-associated NlpC family hydrolase
LVYAVQGADTAPTPGPAPRASRFRQLQLVLLSAVLAVSFVAVEAPAAVQASSSGRTEAQRIVAIARSHIGARFRIGATGPRYFDCSGFIYRVYKQAGLLGRIGGERRLAAGYYHWFKSRGLASRSNPKVGDLVIYTHKGRIAHSAIYVGHNHIISALINPWGVRRTHVNTIRTKFLAYLHVHLQR